MEGKFTLKQARNLRGLSRLKVGEEMQVAARTIKNWEDGATYPDVKTFYKLCKLYNISPSEIFLP